MNSSCPSAFFPSAASVDADCLEPDSRRLQKAGTERRLQPNGQHIRASKPCKLIQSRGVLFSDSSTIYTD